jgi:hypothetical protein
MATPLSKTFKEVVRHVSWGGSREVVEREEEVVGRMFDPVWYYMIRFDIDRSWHLTPHDPFIPRYLHYISFSEFSGSTSVRPIDSCSLSETQSAVREQPATPLQYGWLCYRRSRTSGQYWFVSTSWAQLEMSIQWVWVMTILYLIRVLSISIV